MPNHNLHVECEWVSSNVRVPCGKVSTSNADFPFKSKDEASSTRDSSMLWCEHSMPVYDWGTNLAEFFGGNSILLHNMEGRVVSVFAKDQGGQSAQCWIISGRWHAGGNCPESTWFSSLLHSLDSSYTSYGNPWGLLRPFSLYVAHPHILVRATNEWWVPTLIATSGFQWLNLA